MGHHAAGGMTLPDFFQAADAGVCIEARMAH